MRIPPALRREILAQVEPPHELSRRARAAVRALVLRLRREARRRNLLVQPLLVGSLYKGTHLRDPLDLDVFVLFPAATPRAALERDGIALGQAALETHELKYAEHPYVHGTFQGFVVDVVPAYRIRSISGRLSAVDRSPFHARYVKAHLRPRQAAEVRLLKRFLRGVGCYGADTATGGVSGYLAELLILKFGSLARTMDAIASWKVPVALAIKGPAAALGGSLVFVDPVDPNRNAAAAVQPATLDRLVRAARAFRRRPRSQFFFPNPPRPLAPAELRRRTAPRSLVGVLVDDPPGRAETVLPQGHRLEAKVRRALETEGFQVPRSAVHRLEPAGLLLLWEHAPRHLPTTFEHDGPRAEDADHVERFLAKWKSHPEATAPPAVRAGRWRVRVRRAHRTPAALLVPRLAHLLEGFDYSAKQVAAARLLETPALLQEPRLRLALTEFVLKRDPWER